MAMYGGRRLFRAGTVTYDFEPCGRKRSCGSSLTNGIVETSPESSRKTPFFP